VDRSGQTWGLADTVLFCVYNTTQFPFIYREQSLAIQPPIHNPLFNCASLRRGGLLQGGDLMGRYREDREERNFERSDRFERDRPWNYNQPLEARGQRDYRTEQFRQGRFGERADYEYDEPRYSGYSRGYGESDYGQYDYGRDYESGRRESYAAGRSRLRCRDIMTRDLAVATRDTPLVEIGLMMKDEDTGVIPVVDHQVTADNGSAEMIDRRTRGGGYTYGKLVGLVTDRDIVVRGVTEDKDCRATRAEEIMSTDLYTAHPNDRVVDVLRKMGDKQVRRIPVVSDNGNLRGMISLGDIALETEADRELADALEDISKKTSFWGQIFS
jgi:CBS domain-containing protein